MIFYVYIHMCVLTTVYCTCPAHLCPVPISDDLPAFPDLATLDTLTCYLDAAHANDLRNRRSTTGFVFLLAGGCISYKCKTQTTTATRASTNTARGQPSISISRQAPESWICRPCGIF